MEIFGWRSLQLATWCLAFATVATSSLATAADYIAQGISYQLDKNDLIRARESYLQALALDPRNAPALEYLGACAYHQGNFEEAKDFLQEAINVHPDIESAGVSHCNLIEIFRKLHQPENGLSHIDMCINGTKKSNFSLLVTGWLHKDLRNHNQAIDYLTQLLGQNINHTQGLDVLGSTYIDATQYTIALETYNRIVDIDPMNAQGYVGRGLALHLLNDFNAAAKEYVHALKINPRNDVVRQNLATLYQQLGQLKEAIAIYKTILERQPNNVAVLNNIGAAMLYTGQADEAVVYLNASLELNPKNPHGYVNLKTYYHDEGNIEKAMDMLEKAYEVSHSEVLRIDMAMLLPQVYTSQAHMLAIRRSMEESIDALLQEENFYVKNPEEFEVRPPFYLVYQGMNDMHIQRKLGQLFLRSAPSLHFTAPHTVNGVGSLVAFDRSETRIRVGFMSKFFVDNHAHGLLLRGIIANLDRRVFEVLLLVIPDPQQPVDPAIALAADHVHQLSMQLDHIHQEVARLKLDVLIFADIMSEPINYFAAYSRLAHVQAAFWGNPTTSGIPTVDYFISADAMESCPDPTHGSDDDEHYTEQVVLLDGLGIWYDRPQVPTTLGNRTDYGLDESWTIYMCAQSVYKILPSFDLVVGAILELDYQGHLVFLEARHATWTNQFRRRLNLTLPSHVLDRIHFVPRVRGSDAYLKLISTADVILHPFPFGGSKTSADAFLLGQPLVAMKSPYLRSRMAYSFYLYMDILDCIATTVEEYIQIAIRLGTDKQYRQIISSRIIQSQASIWENKQVVEEWERFLYNSVRSLAT